MAAMAGLLGVQLEKPGHYRLGDAGAPVGAETIAPRLVAGLRRHVRRRRADAAVAVGAGMNPGVDGSHCTAGPIPRSWSGWAWPGWISIGCWTSA